MYIYRSYCSYYCIESIPNKQTNSLIIILEFVRTVGTFIKHCRALVHASKLHGVEIELWVTALWTRLVYLCMFRHLFLFCVVGDPRLGGLGLRSKMERKKRVDVS